jgi:predicted P-loop ATPase
MMNPGCQFDTALTLVGAVGGERKSSFLYALAGPGRSRSNVPDITNPQVVGMAMRRQWIVELGELTAMSSASRVAFKEFITRRVEQFNAKYAVSEAVEPRQCGIAATTNQIAFLDEYDSATRRRFWPILVQKRIDVEWVEAHRDEIWSEAYAAYAAGEQWWYADESTIDAAYARSIVISPLAEQVAAYLEQPSQRASLNGLYATTVAQRILGISNVTAQVQTELGLILSKTPGVTKKRTNRGVTYFFGEAPVAPLLKVVK